MTEPIDCCLLKRIKTETPENIQLIRAIVMPRFSLYRYPDGKVMQTEINETCFSLSKFRQLMKKFWSMLSEELSRKLTPSEHPEIGPSLSQNICFFICLFPLDRRMFYRKRRAGTRVISRIAQTKSTRLLSIARAHIILPIQSGKVRRCHIGTAWRGIPAPLETHHNNHVYSGTNEARKSVMTK